jgi:hypothetical protein
MIKPILATFTLLACASMSQAQTTSPQETAITEGTQSAQLASEPAVQAPSSAEFDLKVEGVGSQSELQTFAENWRQARANEGKLYRVAVGSAQIKGNPGSNTYADAFMLALDDAVLQANSIYISDMVNNDIAGNLKSTNQTRTGFEEAGAEAECQANNRAKLDAKVIAVINQLSTKAIELLGGTNDVSTNFTEGVKCTFEKLVSEVARSFTIRRQMAIRGGRTLKVAVDGQTVSVAIAYGRPGFELADMIRAQRPSDQPNPNAKKEIFEWVEANMLNTAELLPSAGVRSFKLSNGDWVVVSLSIAGLPHQGNMSKAELAHRNQFALEKADALALNALNEFAGAAVDTNISGNDVARFANMFEVAIKDGIVSASFDQTQVRSVFNRENTSKSRGQLRAPMQVKSGARKSEQAEGNVAYAVRAWSPSLLAQARAFESSMKQNYATPKPDVQNQSRAQPKSVKSKPMNEDW